MANGWKWDRDDLRQEGNLGVLSKRMPVAIAHAFACSTFLRRCRADLARCQRYAEAREHDRRHHAAAPGELLDVPELLGRLDGIEHQIVRLRYWDGLNYGQIAERLAIPRDTIQRWHAIALAKMRA